MSIDPVRATGGIDGWLVQAKAGAAGARTRQPSAVPSNLGLVPNRPAAASQRQTKAPELPQDEIQVQRDSQNQIIIKYLDGSGKVIFQVPSSQILALQQAIERELEEQVQRPSLNSRAASGFEGVRNGH